MSDYLPLEIWEKILLRLPIKTLLICISVCKDWKSHITNQSFIQQFTNNTNNSLFLQFRCYVQETVSSQLVPRRRYDKFFSIYSDDDQLADHLSISKHSINDGAFGNCNNFIVIGTCNGLVCLSDYPSSQYNSDATFVLMNPFINKYVVLPKSTNGSLESSALFNRACTTSGFGLDSKNNDFIIVKVFLPYWKITPPWVEVYSLNTGKWRRIIIGTTTGPSFLGSCARGIRREDQVFVNGALHWLVCKHPFGRRDNIILSFDLATETFKILILPECLDSSEPYMELYLLKGGNSSSSLALVHKNYRFTNMIFNIWVMKEYGNVDSWNMIFSFDSRFYGDITRVIAMRNSRELLMLERNSHEIIILDTKKDLVKCTSGLCWRS